MHYLYYLAALLLVNRLNKSIKFSPLRPKWRTLLNSAQWGIIVLFIATQAIFHHDAETEFIGLGLLLAIVLYINNQEDFQSFRFYTTAHYPLIIVGLIDSLTSLIAPDFYDKYGNFFEWGVVGAFVWIFGRWATSKKQREELKIASERNAQLDILVAERTGELTRQKNELEKTVTLLQTTQQQLIQSEKLASLGELTAGIAHEIQNPLNFVNNFSDVSIELIDEMEQELAAGHTEDVVAIANDIKQNLEKIRHHGQRADGIVKSMLQHSRASTGQKEPVSINALADEYFRLAYHGLRAKDKTFNAELVMNFAENLPTINVIPQDIGRVLLNLFTNAFYATQQKTKIAGPDYKPAVEIKTSLIKVSPGKQSIEIRVKDNGIGMPEHIKDKVLQPFFTTKPTGEGTGLGLSLSYDIVVKGHGGNIDLTSQEGEGSEFIITLPQS
jgi:two-component system NtrC family sensor kinase